MKPFVVIDNVVYAGKEISLSWDGKNGVRLNISGVGDEVLRNFEGSEKVMGWSYPGGVALEFKFSDEDEVLEFFREVKGVLDRCYGETVRGGRIIERVVRINFASNPLLFKGEIQTHGA